jgi:hypothetical protein
LPYVPGHDLTRTCRADASRVEHFSRAGVVTSPALGGSRPGTSGKAEANAVLRDLDRLGAMLTRLSGFGG